MAIIFTPYAAGVVSWLCGGFCRHVCVMNDLIPEKDRAIVASLLGREPRGLEAIQVRNAAGEPSVIRVSSLVAGKPFPTLFWLIDRELNYKLDQLESKGVIALIQQQVDSSDRLRQALHQDHESYIGMRKSYMTDAARSKLTELGYYEALMRRGIGGIADFTRIRCLHTYYAAHLVKNNTIGQLLESGHL